MDVEARGLPAVASASGIPEGRAENQRVEITADDPAILDTVQSTYVESVSNTDKFRITLDIEPGISLGRWKIEIYGDDQRLEGLNGEGALEPSYVLDLKDLGLLNIGTYRTITAALEAADSKGQTLRARDTAQRALRTPRGAPGAQRGLQGDRALRPDPVRLRPGRHQGPQPGRDGPHRRPRARGPVRVGRDRRPHRHDRQGGLQRRPLEETRRCGHRAGPGGRGGRQEPGVRRRARARPTRSSTTRCRRGAPTTARSR